MSWQLSYYPVEVQFDAPQIGETVNYASLVAQSSAIFLHARAFFIVLFLLVTLGAIGWVGNVWMKIVTVIGMILLPILSLLFAIAYGISVDTTKLIQEERVEFQGEIYHFARIMPITDGMGPPGYFYILLKCDPTGETRDTLYRELVLTYEQLGDLYLDGNTLYFQIDGETVYTLP